MMIKNQVNALHILIQILYGDFKLLNQKEIDKFNINSIECNSIEENSSNEYILEVDLKYPDELHELRNDYPLAPEET